MSKGVFFNDTGNKITLPQLLINAKLNRLVVIEKLSIGLGAIDTLVQILVRHVKDSSMIMKVCCFVPRHSIILIKNGETSYIDIWFSCSGYRTSKDLQNIPVFDAYRWMDLRAYFNKYGFKYKLEDAPKN